MYETWQAFGDAWRSIAHLTEWSGLSLGILAGLAALVYFDPAALKAGVAGACAVLIAWGCLVHGHAAGVADEDARLAAISRQNDARAAVAANADETARVGVIEAKAKEQHDDDLAEIARLKASGADACAFDPDDDAGGLRRPSAGQATGSGSLSGNPQSAARAKTAAQGAASAAPGRKLHVPLVWRRWLQGKGHAGNAAAHGQR